MAGKLTTILAKKEAEVYCTQGLHREALKLYQRLLAASPNIDTTLKQAVENQIARIIRQLQTRHPEQYARITAKDVLRLKQGWGPEATAEDLMVCAKAFYQIGHYRSALSEMVKLMDRGHAVKGIAGLFADCLEKICPPQNLLATLQRLTRKTFTSPEGQVVFLLALTEKMVGRRQYAHARVLYRYLQTNTLARTKASRRLSSIARGIEAMEERQGSN